MNGGPILISRPQIIARIREVKWRHSTQTKRVEILRQVGTGKTMNVHIKDLFTEPEVRAILKNAGLTRDETDEFIRNAEKAQGAQ